MSATVRVLPLTHESGCVMRGAPVRPNSSPAATTSSSKSSVELMTTACPASRSAQPSVMYGCTSPRVPTVKMAMRSRRPGSSSSCCCCCCCCCCVDGGRWPAAPRGRSSSKMPPPPPPPPPPPSPSPRGGALSAAMSSAESGCVYCGPPSVGLVRARCDSADGLISRAPLPDPAALLLEPAAAPPPCARDCVVAAAEGVEEDDASSKVLTARGCRRRRAEGSKATAAFSSCSGARPAAWARELRRARARKPVGDGSGDDEGDGSGEEAEAAPRAAARNAARSVPASCSSCAAVPGAGCAVDAGGRSPAAAAAAAAAASTALTAAIAANGASLMRGGTTCQAATPTCPGGHSHPCCRLPATTSPLKSAADTPSRLCSASAPSAAGSACSSSRLPSRRASARRSGQGSSSCCCPPPPPPAGGEAASAASRAADAARSPGNVARHCVARSSTRCHGTQPPAAAAGPDGARLAARLATPTPLHPAAPRLCAVRHADHAASSTNHARSGASRARVRARYHT